MERKERPEDLGAEEAVAFRLESAVVDGLRFFDFAERPGPNFFGGSQANLDGIEVLIGSELAEQIK